MTTDMLRGIDDKRRLLGFFAAKKHVNLVLRVADVLELRNEQQDFLINAAVTDNPEINAVEHLAEGKGPGWRKQWLLTEFPNGYWVRPFDQLLERMSLENVQALQAIVYAYADIRRQKGEPCRIDTCEKCKGIGRGSRTFKDGTARPCKDCDGGQVITFIEMSPIEQELAQRELVG